MKEIELINKRKHNEKHFLQEDGTMVARLYNSDVHFLKNGKYEEIDNTLVQQDDYYVNTQNKFKVSFNHKGKDNLMKMEKEGYYLNLQLKGAKEPKISKKEHPSKSIGEIYYTDILDGIDIDYKTLPSKVKETIVLRTDSIEKISFVVDTNLQLELQNDSIVAKSGDQDIFTMEPPIHGRF